MNTHALQTLLSDVPVADIRWHDEIGSTNDEALAWLSAGAQDGSLVAADAQSKGRGRSGRHWVTHAGAALAFSVILKPLPHEITHLTFFTALGAVALASALEGELGLQPQIKWPNDVLLNRRKAAGLLVEASWAGDRLEGVVIGIGLNVSRAAVPPDDQVLFPATSVEDALQSVPDRFALLHRILLEIFYWRPRLLDREFFSAWEKRLAFMGEAVYITPDPSGGERHAGIVRGLDAQGNLLLELRDGRLQAFSVGDLHLRPEKSNGK